MWLDALDLLFSRLRGSADLSKVEMIAGSGQQHGSVYLDATLTPASQRWIRHKSLAEPNLPRPHAGHLADLDGHLHRRRNARKSPPRSVAPRKSAAAADRSPSSVSPARKSAGFSKMIPPPTPEHGAHPSGQFVHRLGDRRKIRFHRLRRRRRHEPAQSFHRWLGTRNCLAATAPGLLEKLPSPAPATTIQGTVSRYFVRKIRPSIQLPLRAFHR